MKTVIITVGIPGSGKSTWAKEDAKSKSNVIWLNADSIRKELYGDESVQGNGDTVFKIFNFRLRHALISNKIENIYIDNTNTTLKARKSIYDLIKKHAPNSTVKVKVFDNFEQAKERNKNRDRVVPDEVMERMIKQFQRPTKDETELNIDII